MKKIAFLFISLVTISVTAVKADSPITSTYFAASYYNYPIVLDAEIKHELTDEIAAFLLDKNNPIDAKAAVINAIGWNFDGSKNSEVFKTHLAKSKGITTAQINLEELTADELFCMGYLLAFDDYFIVDDALNMLEKAASKNKNSFTIHLILNMTKAQKTMDTNFCAVWTLTAEVLNNKSLKRDMKTVAIQSVVDYMILYKPECSY